MQREESFPVRGHAAGDNTSGRQRKELHGGGAFMTRYELKGAVDGSIDPILTIVIKDEGVEYRLVDAVTGEALGDVSGVGLSTVAPR